MFDIVALGELLIDFTESGLSPSGMRLFEQNAGGAPCNMLAAATRLGMSTAFIGKVGEDSHGRFLKKTIRDAGICTDGLLLDEKVFTTLAFVSLAATGEREFSFARKPGADTRLKSEELNPEIVNNCRIFHFGSLSLTDDPARSATFAALRGARASKALVSYDPNYRKGLWKSPELAQKWIQAPLETVDIIKVSEEELEIVTGFSDLRDACAYLHGKNIQCVVITLGKEGAYVSLRGKGAALVEGAPDGELVDKTGAGDAFWGAFLSEYIKIGKTLDELLLEDAVHCARTANVVATLSISKRGGIPAMTYRREVQAALLQFNKEI